MPVSAVDLLKQLFSVSHFNSVVIKTYSSFCASFISNLLQSSDPCFAKSLQSLQQLLEITYCSEVNLFSHDLNNIELKGLPQPKMTILLVKSTLKIEIFSLYDEKYLIERKVFRHATAQGFSRTFPIVASISICITRLFL